MARITLNQVLFMRAIYGMPAGASVPAIHAAIREDTGLDIQHGFSTLRTLLEKRYISERRVVRPGMRHEPLCYYSLTPAGKALLAERTVRRMQPIRIAPPAPEPQIFIARRPRHPRLPQHRPATRKECKAVGVPLWQRWGRHA